MACNDATTFQMKANLLLVLTYDLFQEVPHTFSEKSDCRVSLGQDDHIPHGSAQDKKQMKVLVFLCLLGIINLLF
ncbi:hypothetical protein VNO77_01201 [Canavalia gladiata]|uniref:Uncharacterized protein n=1 Tax=Canavalia gladiata TaxID=3824 RepID=A0AAN9MVM1_CANGL